jgi:hypothetical protein
MMQVQRAEPAGCLTCHTHRASAHLATDNRCAACHVPLTAARGLSRERVAALPRPPSHDSAGFEGRHAPTGELAGATCAVCHARESCARCHVNASTEPLIASLGRDERVAALLANRAAVYPVPADHRSDAFRIGHGDAARTATARCATCHARPSCTTCHLGAGAAEVIRRMPRPEPGGAAGVQLRATRPRDPPPGAAQLLLAADAVQAAAPHSVRVHDPGFRTAHRAQASAGALSCSGCHEQRFCSDCHAGEGRRRFHPANFTVRHAANAYGRDTDCSSCHNTEAFCRDCHARTGMGSRGRLDVAFHSAQPTWLLQHGRAARQGLQNCATCHAQRDCLTCHSTVGWGINPHGRGFDARAMAARTPTTCLACHLEVPRPR